MRHHITAVVVLVVSGCATGAQQIFRAASDDTIQSGSEMSYGGDGFNVYVTNGSTEPILVTGVRLYECDNIKTRCDGTVTLKLRVDPGRRQNIYLVRIDNATRASHFQFHYTWQRATPQ